MQSSQYIRAKRGIEYIKIYEGETRIVNYENSPRIALKLIDTFERENVAGNFSITVENSNLPVHDGGIIERRILYNVSRGLTKKDYNFIFATTEHSEIDLNGSECLTFISILSFLLNIFSTSPTFP